MCTNTKAEWKGFFKALAFFERHRKRLPHDAGHTDGTGRACLVSSGRQSYWWGGTRAYECTGGGEVKPTRRRKNSSSCRIIWAKKWRVLSWPWKNLRWKLDGFLWVKNETPAWSGKNIYLTPRGWCYPVCAWGSQHSECSGVGLGTATTSRLVPSPLHACACVHTYLCGSRRFQRTLSVFPSGWGQTPLTGTWLPEETALLHPPAPAAPS